jgi:thioredoxin 1
VAWGMLAFVIGVLVMGAALQIWMAMKSQAIRGQRVEGVAGVPAEGVRLLWFHSPGCGPCKVMEPTVRELAKDRPVTIVDVTVDPEAASRFGVMGTPTTVVVRDGVVERVQLGVVPKGALEAMLA